MAKVNLKGGSDQAGKDNVRHGLQVIPILIKPGGIVFPTPTFLKAIGRLSDVQNISAPSAEFVNEREHFESGKKRLQLDDGVKWEMTITFEGDHTTDVAAMIGQDLHTDRNIRYGQNYPNTCDLIVYSIQDNFDVKVCDYYLNIGIKLGQLPGTEDGELNYDVIAYGLEDSIVGRIDDGNPLAYEIWYDNASTVINTDAPDGAKVAFTLGDGNDSYAAAAPPDTLPHDTTASTPLTQYFFKVWVDGAEQGDNEVSFVQATGVLTFTTAPVDGAKLEVWYIVDDDGTGPLGQPPHLHSGSNQLTDWKTHQRA